MCERQAVVSETGSKSEIVVELAEEFIDRYRRGERPPLAEYTAKYPDLAQRILDVFPAMAMMENIAIHGDASEASGDGGSAPDASHPASIGDYRIIREVGRGGMGIVYEAEQLSLGRRVALKVLPQQMLLDKKHKRRFEREAKAAAKLHHTNIVPVFGVGEQDGLHYYVMQFIQGLGLDEVIGELQRMKASSLAGRPVSQGEMPAGRRSGDFSAARVARSLMSGEFDRTILTVQEREEAPRERLGSTVGFDPNGPQARVTGPATRLEVQQSGQGVLEMAVQSAGLESTSGGRLSDSLSLSGSLSLPSQSDASISTSASRARRKQTFWTSVANIGRQVASALQYAHEQGITHRDIKPSNLLLDMRGTVWVTDFGLAKATDQQDITHTGDILGTLRYMPPEAFEGKSGPAGDQYSLGLTLYELLAQRPAFEEKDRHKLIRLVTTSEPPRLEKLNRDVPRDLATIVHKSIDRDPSHRYASARELADDLERFLEDEPIKARRVSMAERFQRWSRRNRGLAAALSVISALILILAIGSTVAAGYFRTVAREKSKLAEDNRRLAETQARQAEHMRSLADEKGRLAEEKETERRNAEQAKTEALAAKTEIERQSKEIDQQRQRAEQSLYVSQIALAERHLEAADSINAQRSLTAALPDNGEPDRRGWEWYYLNHWRDSAERTLTGHSARFVYALAISPDGRWLASAGGGNPYFANPGAVVEPGEVLLREFETGRVVHVLKGHENIGSALAFSPDGRLLATGGHDQRVVLWQTQTGEPIQTIIHPRAVRLRDAHAVDKPAGPYINRVRTIHFAPNNSRLMVLWGEGDPSDDTTATVYSLPDARPVHEFRTRGAVFDQDGSQLYVIESETNRRVRVLDLASLEVSDLIKSDLIRSPLWGLTCDGARRRLAAFCREEALLFDLATGDLVQRFPAPEGTAALALSPDGRFLAIHGASNVLQVWDVETGRNAATLLGHTANVTGADFSPDSQWVATGSMDGTVRIYPAGQGARGISVATDQTQVSALAFGDDGATIRTANWEGDDRGIFTWNTGRFQPVLAHLGRVTDSRRWPRGDFAFSADGGRLAAPMEDDPSIVKIWDAVSGDELISLTDHPGPVTAVAFSIDGALLATASETPAGAVFQMWNAATGQLTRAPHSAAHVVLAIAFSRDGQWLATGGQPVLNGPGVSIWDLNTGEAKAHFQGPIHVFRVAFSPSGAQLAAADYRLAEVLVWDVELERQVAELAGLHAVSDVAWSPDGSRLAAIGYDADVHLWNAQTFDELLVLRTLGPPTGTLGFTPRLAFSPDGARIAANSAHGVVSVWDAGLEFANHELNALFSEAQRRLSNGEYEQAAAAASRAVELQIANRPARRLQALAWFVLADCRAQQGDPQSAGESRARGRSLLEGLIAEDPGDVESATELARRLVQSQHIDWTVLKPSDMKSAGGATLTLLEDGSILAGGNNPTKDVYTLTATCALGEVRAIRLEVLPDATLPGNGPGRHRTGNFQLAALRIFQSLNDQGEPAEPLAISDALASYEYPGLTVGISGTIDEADPRVWHIWPRVGEPHHALFRLATPLVMVENQSLTIQLEHSVLPPGTNLGRFRLSVTGDVSAFDLERARVAIEQGDLNGFHALAVAYGLHGQADKAAAALISAAGLAASPESLTAVEQHIDEIIPLDFDAAAARVREILDATELAALSRAVVDDPENFAAWAARGAWYVRHGRWAEAAADWSQSVALNPDANSVDWMVPSALWAYAGDVEQHRRQCQLMAERFLASTDPPDAERTVKVMLLLEDGLDPEHAPVDAFLASLAADSVDPGLRKWFVATQALLACRAGRFDEAQRSVEESLRLVQEAGGDARGSAPGLFAIAVQALIHARQVAPDEARPALDELKMLMRTQAGLTWNAGGSLDGRTLLSGERVQHDLLIPEILRREAERLLQTPADGPMTSETPADNAEQKPAE